MNVWIKTFTWFVLLIALQVMLFNHLQLAFVINTFPYIYVVLSFPNAMNRIARTLIGFALGFIIDMLCGTWGVHTIATTLAAFIQPMLLKMVALPEQLDRKAPSFHVMKWKFLEYTVFLVLIHHALLFSLESFDISLWIWVLIKTVVSSIVTIGISMIFDKMSNP